MAMLGASAPKLEALLEGRVPGVPQLNLIHATLALEAGANYMDYLYRAWHGELAPYVLVLEGSLFDENLAGQGCFSRLGEEDGQPVTSADWVTRLAPGAMAVIAIGSCAAWGGVPAAAGNVTGAMGLDSFLGDDFVCESGLPVINVPGCAPHGDAFLELITHLFLHLAEAVPLELDEQRRPRWLYHPTTYPRPPQGRHNNNGAASETISPVGCPVPTRGWMNRIGGCGEVGGHCIGCTMPNFVDHYLPLARIEAG